MDQEPSTITRIPVYIKVTALKNLLVEAEARAKRHGIPFSHEQLPGRKLDLLMIARQYCPELASLKEGRLESYMAILAYKFKHPVRHSPYQNAYHILFPEYFQYSAVAT
jgi:hypothetical protein